MDSRESPPTPTPTSPPPQPLLLPPPGTINLPPPPPWFPFNSPNSWSSVSVSQGLGSRKRGRPRNYPPDGRTVSTGLAPISRPSNKKLNALVPFGVGLTPNIIVVGAGEDIVSKIMAFSQQGPRTVCVLCANGTVENVTLRQPATSGGTVTYEGQFEIITLSGSISTSEDDNGIGRRTGGLSVSLAGPDGRLVGGAVAGMLIAATPVQIVVGSFDADGKDPKLGPSPLPPPPNTFNASAPVAAGNPPPSGSSNESSYGSSSSSPLNTYFDASLMPTSSNTGWPDFTPNLN